MESVAARISLLFEAGRRPGIDDVRTLLSQDGLGLIISHVHSGTDARHGVELLAQGLAFDLTGLAPGTADAMPPCLHRFDLSDGCDSADLEVITLQPGHHLSGGTTMKPVVQTMMNVAGALCPLDGLVAVAWHPASSWLSPAYFASMIRNWLEGGIFPARGLVGLELSADGGLQSEGAAFFTGQEVRVEPELVESTASATKIAVRLIDHLVENGPFEAVEQMVGPDGRMLKVMPSSNQRFVRIWGG